MSKNGEGNRPITHIAYSKSEGHNGFSHYETIGSAVEHMDKGGLNLKLLYLPNGGNVILRSAKEKVVTQQIVDKRKLRSDSDRGQER